jgi:Mce-associated membrane protein
VTPTWYDVLDVDPTASTDDIRAAWQRLVADLGPTDRRFRVVNQAAEVLLDPARRAAYDAELAAAAAPADPVAPDPVEAPEPMAAPEPEPVLEPAPVPVPDVTPAGPTSLELQHIPADHAPRGGVPGWLIVAIAFLTAVVVGVTAWLWATRPDGTSTEDAARAARSAAETAAVPILSYDYRHLDRSQAAADAYLTSGYRKKYDDLFAALRKPAQETKAVVTASLLDSGIVRTGADRVQVLLFVDQARTNKVHKTPDVFQNQVTVFMERVDGDWLVDCMVTTSANDCSG